MTAMERAEQAFRAHYGTAPDGVTFASGRVNLIGEHVDYNDGLVLPMPIAQGTAVAWGLAAGQEVELFAEDMGEADSFPLTHPARPPQTDWRSYCRGMVANAPFALGTGCRLAIAGDMPRGGGLSSSASLCIAVGRALAAVSGGLADAVPLALAAQRSEHEFAGVSCGIMDQMAIAAGRSGEAMMLDCRDLSYVHVQIPRDWAVVVVDSGITRGLVEGEYNARRSECAEAASLLGVASLRDATPEMVEQAHLPPVIERRARHVVDEIARVRRLVGALRANDIGELTDVMREGHASLRDNFEVSVPGVDRLVDRLQALLGAKGGARMTGAGFGGSIVVVAERETATRILSEIEAPVIGVLGVDTA
ncbi:galactokinase [Tsuneonella sp. HG249]